MGGGPGSGGGFGEGGSYWTRSMRPLHILAFLLPLLLAYEVGSFLYLTDAAHGLQRTIEARRVMDDFFRLLGIAGYVVPGFAMATVLIVWHIMSRERWTIDLKTVGTMFVESVAWTLPLMVMAAAKEHARGMGGAGLMVVQEGAGGVGIGGQPMGAGLTLAVGAGLYEEMLFRLVGLAVLHFILADLIGLPARVAAAGAVLLSAVAFAVYHQPPLTDYSAIGFYLLSGIYLGTIYILRGFGIAVGTHAMYDVVIVLFF